MPTLHYGPDKTFDVDADTADTLIKAIGGKIGSDDGGGWIDFTDTANKSWCLLAAPGIPMYIDAKLDPSA